MIQEYLIWRESDIIKSIVLSRHFPGQETETKSSGKMAVVTSEKGVVAADHETCSEIGADVLRRLGGTAVDAAVAVAFSLGVNRSIGCFTGS
ncbi:BnaA03g49420D [Brassica napus]|uniref:BnaA03g49420D protein n=1 Tax=Brassica napus TaxID=3708 RepID=A0A078H063_BRANA|nr:BnaA03g49420D [Brassica napus]